MDCGKIIYHYLLDNSQENLGTYRKIRKIWQLKLEFGVKLFTLCKQNASKQPPSPTSYLGSPRKDVQMWTRKPQVTQNDRWGMMRRRILGAAMPTPVALSSLAKPEPKRPLPSSQGVREERRSLFWKATPSVLPLTAGCTRCFSLRLKSQPIHIPVPWGYWFSLENGNLTVWSHMPSVCILLHRILLRGIDSAQSSHQNLWAGLALPFFAVAKAANKWSIGDWLNYMQPHRGDHWEAKNGATVARWSHVKWKSAPQYNPIC